MKEYGLIGHPLGHSFSKKFFTDKFLREGIDAAYTNFDITDARMLLDIIQEHPDLVGVNCTIPHKESVMRILDDISQEAQEIGAVNVIKILRPNQHIWAGLQTYRIQQRHHWFQTKHRPPIERFPQECPYPWNRWSC